MNPELKTWLTLFGTLALETTAVLAVAAILAARMRHGSWRRFVWQGGLCATLLLSVGELSGFNRALTVRVQPKQAAVALPAAKPTPVEPTASTSERKISVRVLERSGTTDTFSLPTEASSNSVSLWLPVLWLVGSAFILGRSAVCRLVFSVSRRRLACMSTSPELQAQTQRLASLIGMTRSLRVYQMDNLPAPIAWGIVRPAICFPSSFCTDYTEPQREVMILHELAHLQANDPLWLIVSDATLALLWWHPAAWWARHEFRAACELAADEASLRLEQGPELLAEGLVLLGKRLPVAGGIATFGMAGNGFRSALAQRVQRLLQLNGSQVRPIGWSVRFGASVIGASLIAAIAFTGTLLLAQPQSAQARTLPELWHGSMLALLGPEATTKPSPQRSKANGEPEIETVRLPVDFKKLHRGLEIELDRVLSEHQVLNEITKLVPRTPETRLRNFRYDPDNGKLIMQGTQDATDFIAEKVTSLVAPVPQVEIEVRLVEIKGQEALLMKLLGTNFSYAPVFESRPRWKPDLASDIEIAARTNKNIRLDFMPEISGQPLLLKRSQAQPLIAAFENQTGVEILTTPRVTTFSGHEAQIAVTDSKSIYTVVIPPPADAKPTPSPEGNVVSVPVTMTLSQTFELGPASYLRPTVLPNGRDIQLNVIMRHAEFLGYDARTNATTGANVNTSQPHFRIRQVRIDTKIPSGSTLVLGSAPIAETIIMKDKVVGLGDLPVVGELFRTTTTNTLKKQMLVLVTPRRVSGEVNSTATKKTDEP